ncbi:MAG: methyltransferase family protein [Candidatus Heimdallarchaeota archaeon]
MREANFIVTMIIRLVIAFFLFSCLLFLPAGTLEWPEAWAFIIILLIYGIVLHLLIFKNYPNALKSRQRYKPVFGTDTIILILAGICLFAMFIILGLDVGQYQWTALSVPSLFKYLGFSAFVCSLIIYMLVMKENIYLSRVIEIQEKQQVISTGPYAFVRHPMYLGNVLFAISIPFALGSFLALVPALFFVILLGPRIIFEEKILIEELNGYREYMQQVRYRIIPRIW